MGNPTDLVRGVIEGNLAGANDEIKLLDAQIAELVDRRAARDAERVEYEELLSAHAGKAGEIHASETLAQAEVS